jgi:hypothetical protein
MVSDSVAPFEKDLKQLCLQQSTQHCTIQEGTVLQLNVRQTQSDQLPRTWMKAASMLSLTYGNVKNTNLYFGVLKLELDF